MQKTDALNLVKELCEAFQSRKEIAKETVLLYAEYLLDLDYNEAKKSVRKIIVSQAKFFPAIGEIRMPIFESKVLSVTEAWAEVIKAVEQTGFNVTPKFSNPLIKRAVEMITWQKLREMTIADAQFEEKRFYRFYGDFRTEEVKRLNMESLEGK